EPVVGNTADAVPEPAPLGPEHDHEIALPYLVGGIEQALVGLGIERDHPEPLALRALQGARQVDDPGHGQVLESARAGPADGCAEGGRVAVRQQRAARPCARPRPPGAPGGGAWRSGNTAPVAPAPSAARSSAPTFWGSSTPSRATTRRRPGGPSATPPPRVGAGGRPAPGTSPWVRLPGASRWIWSAEASTTGTPASRARLRISA